MSVDATWYRHPKETKGARDGERGVGASRSTDEAGEPEPRGPGGGKGELGWRTVARTDDETQSSMNISPKLQRIATQAKEHPERAFTNLAHHIDLDLLREAYRLTRKTGATGVDGVSGADYAQALEENLTALHERFKSGRYRAPDVRRVHIPK